jgi:hypothetical protein
VRTLLVLALVGLSPAAVQADEPKPKPKPLKVVLPVGDDYVPTVYLGRVTVLTEEKITIKPEGDLRAGPITVLPDGTEVHRLYVQDNTKPPKTFVFSDSVLAFSGMLPPGRRYSGQTANWGDHKISEVLVGDRVFINYLRRQGIDTCINIRISRRPGGKVPPGFYDDKTTWEYRSDNRANTEQFLEEKLIPAYRDLKLLPAR